MSCIDSLSDGSRHFRLMGIRETVDEKRATELIAPLADLLSKSEGHKISTITLSGKSFSPEASTVFSSYISELINLRFVNYSDIIAGQETSQAMKSLTILTNSLKGRELIELNLSDNALGVRGIPSCSGALIGQYKSIKKLFFNNNGLQGDAVDQFVRYFFSTGEEEKDSQQLNTTPKSVLEQFEINNNLLQNAGAIALTALFSHSPQLKYIRVSTTRISKEGGAAMLKSLENHSNLISINFSDNSFGNGSAQIIAKILLKNQQSLKSILLSDLSFEGRGVRPIISALSSFDKTSPLESLDLSFSSLTPSSIESLANILPKFSQLLSLSLEGNSLHSTGVIPLCRTLISHPSLQSINLIQTSIQKLSAIDALFSLVSSLPKFTTLLLRDNKLSAESMEKIENYVEKESEKRGGKIEIDATDQDEVEEDEDEDFTDEEEEEEEEEEDDEEIKEVKDERGDQLINDLSKTEIH